MNTSCMPLACAAALSWWSAREVARGEGAGRRSASLVIGIGSSGSASPTATSSRARERVRHAQLLRARCGPGRGRGATRCGVAPPSVELERLRPEEVAMDRVVEVDADAAVQMLRGGRDARAAFGGPELRDRASRVRVLRPRRAARPRARSSSASPRGRSSSRRSGAARPGRSRSARRTARARGRSAAVISSARSETPSCVAASATSATSWSQRSSVARVGVVAAEHVAASTRTPARVT